MAQSLIERRVQIDDWPVNLRVGTAGDVDVVLIHGIPGSGHSWDCVLPRLPDTVRPFVPDLLGFGESGRPTSIDDLHAEGQARRLESALEQSGIGRAILVGHDFGGPVALHLLTRNPERYTGLILAATNLFGDTPIPFPLSLVNAPLIGGIAARLFFSRAALAMMCRFGARKDHVDVGVALGDRQQTAAIGQIFAASLARLDELYAPIESALADIRIPTLVVWGDRDPFFPSAQLTRTASAIPGARTLLLPGHGHFLPDEAPEALAQAIVQITTIVREFVDSPACLTNKSPNRFGLHQQGVVVVSDFRREAAKLRRLVRCETRQTPWSPGPTASSRSAASLDVTHHSGWPEFR